MNAILILAGVFVLYELVTNQQQMSALLARLGAGTGTASAPLQLPAYQTVAAQSTSGTQAAESLGGEGVAAGLNYIPIIGPAVSQAFKAIFGALMQASAKRAAQARTENQAVANGVPAWDAAIAQIASAYNSGQISAGEASSLFDTALSNFWNEVTPQIQPGRNGCSSGKSCPAPSSQTNEGGNNYCTGSIGAACCVGCADLDLSTHNLKAAVAQQAATGQPVSAFVQVVYASKYGGVNRPAYNINFT